MAWKPDKRRRCRLESCNQLFWPVRQNQRFCCPPHKSEYHLKTPSFRKFEDEIEKLMLKVLRREVKPEALRSR